MYKKIFQKEFPCSFGDQVFIFQSERDYLVIIFDRDGVNYYFVDKELKYMYPASSYMWEMGIVPEDAFRDALGLPFKIDLSKLGHAVCPEWLVKLIGPS